MGSEMVEELEKRTLAKVSARLIPFLILCYFVAYLDRVNLAFAALEMNKDLAFSATVYGTGAGIFFLSYFLLETPSNLVLVRVGARRWIARIMFTWGILSGCMAFVSGETGFYIVRFLLGAAEAGFFPGIIFYLTLWFPGVLPGPHHRHVHGRHSAIGGDRRAAVRRPAVSRRRPRPQGMAVDLHSGGDSRGHPLRRRLLLSDRKAGGTPDGSPPTSAPG